jgi:hypothetical protein
MVNYILGVKWVSPYRFTISRKDETTLSTNVYSIHSEMGFRIPYSLTIVDTPGKMDVGAMQQFLLNSEMKLSSMNALSLVSKAGQMLRLDEVIFVNSLISVFNAKNEGTHPRLIVTSYARQVPPTIVNKFQGVSLARDQSSQTIFYNFNNSWLWQNTLVGSASSKANWEPHLVQISKNYSKNC